MGSIKIFLRRLVGFVRALIGRGKARTLLRELKKIDVSRYVNRIISDGVLLNQIPSPSDAEKLRMEFIMQRLRDFGLSNIIIDELGNVAVLFPAFGTKRDFLLVTADVGDSDYTPLESSVRLTEDRASGQGFGETSLGAAALLVFAEFAQATSFHLDKNLLLLFTKSLSVDENYEAYRRFLDAWAGQISHGIVVRGTGLGTVESRQVGAYRLSLTVKTPECELLSTGSTVSAASVLGSIAFQVGGVSADAKQSAVVNVARMEAGIGYGHWTSEGSMDVEILSEDERILEAITNIVRGTIERAGAGASLDLRTRSRHSVGDSVRNAPLTDALRASLAFIKEKPEIGIISEKVALLNDHGIPAVAVGITKGKKTFEEDYVELEPLESGFRQLLFLVERTAGIVPGKEIALR
ncbi:MAG TPA: hypothetical protein DIC34_06095 [Treponema sp.]|nr:MAG: hypothetical protein A2Y36_17905 [Treponema sp. GWA1_62_8]HCM26106.1 hypothetical protein [Treponema sp.]